MDAETGKELEATVAARRELGPDHEDVLVASFLAKIEQEIDRRVDERVARRAPRGSPLNPATLGVSIPIIAIAGGIGGTAGLIVAFAALVIVFIVATERNP